MTARELHELGWGPLVSVVPPDGNISPGSRIDPASRGKVPGKLGPSGWYGYDFTRPENAPAPGSIDEWGANVGLLADHFPAVDIDVEHEVLAKVVRKFCDDVLGWGPTRYSSGNRMLVMYRTDQPFPRAAIKLTYEGQAHTVEVLGRGRQYLIAGTHPSGNPYRWQVPLTEYTPEDLTLITEIQIAELFEALEEALTPRGVTVERVGRSPMEITPPPPEELLAPSIEELRALVARLPNDYPDRDTYIGIGHAIKAAAGPEYETEALEIYQEWASRWADGHNDPETVERDFASFRPPFRIGWPQLEREAYTRAQELLRAREELRLAEEQVRELQTVMPPGLDEFEYEEAPPPEHVSPPGLPLVHIDVMLARPQVERPWVVGGLLPLGGLALLAAKPKVGKSTLARELAVAVAKGEPFLGRDTLRGPVVYISLEDPAWHVQREFERLGAAGADLWIFEGPAPGEANKLLWETVEALRPVLVIIDTAQRWLRVRDLNDYAEVTGSTDAILRLVRGLGTCVLLTHHSPKVRTDDVADAALGSTALFGSVDVGIFLQRDDTGRRYIWTRQRIPDVPDIEGLRLEIDPKTHRSRLGQTQSLTAIEQAQREIVAYLSAHPGLRESELLPAVDGRTQAKKSALRRLVDTGLVEREGRGTRAYPYTYRVAEFGFEATEELIGPEEEQ